MKLEIEFLVRPDWYDESGRPAFSEPVAAILHAVADKVRAGGLESACGRWEGLAWVQLDWFGTMRKRPRRRRKLTGGGIE